MNATSNNALQINVQCYAGYRGEETPRTLWLASRKIQVTQILDRWLAPDHRYFKCLGDDGAVYIIRHDENTWTWELTFFQERTDL
jgi:hypothetical protein